MQSEANLRFLLVEDDFGSRIVIQKYLDRWGETHTAVSGRQAVAAFIEAFESGEPFHLICLDVMMPELNGHEALQQIREFEKSKGIVAPNLVKVVMTSALSDSENVSSSYRFGCEGYLVKPVSRDELEAQLRLLKIIP